MTVWGFDFSELSWSAFGRKSMFDPRWHLRPERLVVYTLTLIVCMAAQSAATYSLFKYESLQNHIEAFSMHNAHVFNNDIVAAAVLSVVFPCLAQLLFTIEYFILLFWPNRIYPRWYNASKKWTFTGVTGGMTATAIISTAIVGTHSAIISGVDETTALHYTQVYFRPPLRYNSWPQNVVWLVLLWIAVVLSTISVILLHMAISHDEKYGTQPEQTRASNSEKFFVQGKEVTK